MIRGSRSLSATVVRRLVPMCIAHSPHDRIHSHTQLKSIWSLRSRLERGPAYMLRLHACAVLAHVVVVVLGFLGGRINCDKAFWESWYRFGAVSLVYLADDGSGLPGRNRSQESEDEKHGDRDK